LSNKLAELHRSSNGLIIENVISSDKDGVINFNEIDEKAGTLDEFKVLTSMAKNFGEITYNLMSIN